MQSGGAPPSVVHREHGCPASEPVSALSVPSDVLPPQAGTPNRAASVHAVRPNRIMGRRRTRRMTATSPWNQGACGAFRRRVQKETPEGDSSQGFGPRRPAHPAREPRRAKRPPPARTRHVGRCARSPEAIGAPAPHCRCATHREPHPSSAIRPQGRTNAEQTRRTAKAPRSQERQVEHSRPPHRLARLKSCGALPRMRRRERREHPWQQELRKPTVRT